VIIPEPPEDPDSRNQRSAYDATYAHAGGEISSTSEGRHVNILEDLMVHPTHADGFVNKGDPVVAQMLVGIALNSATSINDVIVVETEGVWWLDVYADPNMGFWGGISVGDMLFIDPVTAQVNNNWWSIPFGHALGPVAQGATTLIAVKVHAFQLFYPGWLMWPWQP
jgi:hypothetical protein